MTRNQGLAIGDSRCAPGIRPGATTAKTVPQILFAEGGLQAGLSSSPDSASDATRCLVSCSTAQRCRQRQRYLALLLLAMTSYVSGTRRHEITRKPRACFLVPDYGVHGARFDCFVILKVRDRHWPSGPGLTSEALARLPGQVGDTAVERAGCLRLVAPRTSASHNHMLARCWRGVRGARTVAK